MISWNSHEHRNILIPMFNFEKGQLLLLKSPIEGYLNKDFFESDHELHFMSKLHFMRWPIVFNYLPISCNLLFKLLTKKSTSKKIKLRLLKVNICSSRNVNALTYKEQIFLMLELYYLYTDIVITFNAGLSSYSRLELLNYYKELMNDHVGRSGIIIQMNKENVISVETIIPCSK